MREVSRETGVDAIIHPARIEVVLPELARQTAIDVVSARAFAA